MRNNRCSPLWIRGEDEKTTISGRASLRSPGIPRGTTRKQPLRELFHNHAAHDTSTGCAVCLLPKYLINAFNFKIGLLMFFLASRAAQAALEEELRALQKKERELEGRLR